MFQIYYLIMKGDGGGGRGEEKGISNAFLPQIPD